MITLTKTRDDLAAIEKARKDRKRARADREPLTSAHEQAQGEMDARAEDARKAYRDRGITAGPGTFTEPGTMTPEQVDRPYISDGHASASPLHQPPNQNPMPAQNRGVLTPVRMPGTPAVAGTGPIAAAIGRHQARAAATMPSLPVPGRSA
jgi:hypothetical protein